MPHWPEPIRLEYSASPAKLVAEIEAEEARRRGEALKVQGWPPILRREAAREGESRQLLAQKGAVPSGRRPLPLLARNMRP